MSSQAVRLVRRIMLALLAVISFAIAATALWPVVTGASLPVAESAENLVGMTMLDPRQAAWAVAALVALIGVAALLWAVFPHRHRVSEAVATEGVRIDTAVVEGLARRELRDAPDVLGVDATAFRRRGERWVRVRVQVRPRIDLADTVRRVHEAVVAIDGALGVRVPTMVHITTGFRSMWSRGRRVD